MKSSAFRKIIVGLAASFVFHFSFATVYHVSTSGNDVSGTGTSANPWRTLQHAITQVPAGQGHTIQLGAGTFVENGPLDVPLGVNIEGAGINATTIEADTLFYYYPEVPGYAFDKFLVRLQSASKANGSQSLKNFTVNGAGYTSSMKRKKKLHGGIFIKNRDNILVDSVQVDSTNFNGIWLWESNDSKILNSELINCSWGSDSYVAGALHLGNLQRVEVANLKVNEGVGYGIKAIGPDGINNLTNLVIHDCRVSVNPVGLWQDGKAPNIAIELWQVNLVECEIYNCYVDNTISLVNSLAVPSTGVQTIRVHHDTLDIVTRANGKGYGIELTLHDAEVDHNYFIKGTYGIVNWDIPKENWNIHHNVFYGIEGPIPGEIVRSQLSGLHNVNFYNNTVEFVSDSAVNVIGLYAGSSDNIQLINNLFINNVGDNSKPNGLISKAPGAVATNVQVKNNLFDDLDRGNILGVTYSNNLTGDAEIAGSGKRPDPYYQPIAGSPLIDAGMPVGFPYNGSAPDIGAYEYTSGASALMTSDDSDFSVSTSRERQLTVYPNPSSNHVTVQYASAHTQRVRVTIYDAGRTVVKQAIVRIEDGTNNILLNMAGMDGGTYYLQLQSEDGKRSLARIVISR